MKIDRLMSSQQRFTLAALDRIEFYQEILGVQPATPEGKAVLEQFITLVVSKLSNSCSGLILEPQFGFTSLKAKAAAVGIAFALENRHDAAPLQPPHLNESWGVEACKENYGVAKLEFFYNPEEDQSLAKKQLVAEIYDFCQYVHIDLLVLIRGQKAQGGVLASSALVDAQLQTVIELQKNCDVIGLEYPGTALAAATITSEIDIPWLLVSSSQVKLEPYIELKNHVREVIENGASGCILGEVLFSDLNDHIKQDATLDWEYLETYVATQVRDRLVEIARIVDETKVLG